MDNITYQKFVALVCRLSPENLHCDGECTAWEVKQRSKQIHAEWRALEKQVGRTISQEEIENRMYAEYR